MSGRKDESLKGREYDVGGRKWIKIDGQREGGELMALTKWSHMMQSHPVSRCVYIHCTCVLVFYSTLVTSHL